jgi:putative transposase
MPAGTTFGPLSLPVPRARLHDAAGEQEWKSAFSPAYKRLSHRAEALIAEAYLARMNARRVRRALARLFEGLRRQRHHQPRLAKNPLGLGGLAAAWSRRRRHRPADPRRHGGQGSPGSQAIAISLLIALGIRSGGQKVALAIKNMGGESEAAWRAVLDDLTSRGLARPDLVIVDGGKGLEGALASLWDDVPVQRCAVHKERNLLAHAPSTCTPRSRPSSNDMIQARTAEEVLGKRKVFLARWRLRCRAVADSLEEAGERLFTFLRYPPEQWRSLRTTNAIERLHEEYKRWIKTQCLLPCAETAAMLFWALLASGQITMRRVEAGRPWIAHPPPLTSQPDEPHHVRSVPAPRNFHQPRDTTTIQSDRSYTLWVDCYPK